MMPLRQMHAMSLDFRCCFSPLFTMPVFRHAITPPPLRCRLPLLPRLFAANAFDMKPLFVLMFHSMATLIDAAPLRRYYFHAVALWYHTARHALFRRRQFAAAALLRFSSRFASCRLLLPLFMPLHDLRHAAFHYFLSRLRLIPQITPPLPRLFSDEDTA